MLSEGLHASLASLYKLDEVIHVDISEGERAVEGTVGEGAQVFVEAIVGVGDSSSSVKLVVVSGVLRFARSGCPGAVAVVHSGGQH